MPGTCVAAMRRRLPPPARRPTLWAELLRHGRAHKGRLTLLDPPRPSFAAVSSLTGGNATTAVQPRASLGLGQAVPCFWCKNRKFLVWKTGGSGFQLNSNFSLCSDLPKFVEIRRKILKMQNQFL